MWTPYELTPRACDLPYLPFARLATTVLRAKFLNTQPEPIYTSKQQSHSNFNINQETCLYGRLNAALRTHDTVALDAFLPYMKLLLSGLYQLPLTQVPTYRGVKLELYQVSGSDFIRLITCCFNNGIPSCGANGIFADDHSLFNFLENVLITRMRILTRTQTHFQFWY